jgi:hypothetical protein
MSTGDCPTSVRVNLYPDAMASLTRAAALTEVDRETVINRAVYSYDILTWLANHPGHHATVNLLGDDTRYVVAVMRRRSWHRWLSRGQVSR